MEGSVIPHGLTLLPYRWQLERRVDQRSCTFEIEVAIDVLLYQEGRAAVKLLVLLLSAAEFRSDQVPGKPHECHFAFGIGRCRAHVALDVWSGLAALEIPHRRRQGDQSGAREFANDLQHAAVEFRLQRHGRIEARL